MGSPAASGFSVAGAGLSAYGDIVRAQGIQAGDVFKANVLQENAQRGRVAAVETGAQFSQKLASDLGNIDAIRAAAHTDPTSPSGAAVRDYHEQIGLTQKAIAVDTLMAQSRQQDAEAQYLRQAGKSALMSGYISAGADIFKGLSSALGGATGSIPIGGG